MTASGYVFGDVADARELHRLRRIEGALDKASRRVRARNTRADGWSCLEGGAGAGSIANWLADAVGPSGKVVALDVAPRGRDLRGNVQGVRRDIREWEAQGAHHLAHARYVLIHIPDFERAIARMVASLRPDGWLVLEEPDFLASRFVRGSGEHAASFGRVNAAIERMFVGRDMNPSLGAVLPAALRTLGLTLVAVESEAHLVSGGSEIALMMKASTEQLRDKYVATGLASDDDIENYSRFAEDEDAWAIYYATVRVLARR